MAVIFPIFFTLLFSFKTSFSRNLFINIWENEFFKWNRNVPVLTGVNLPRQNGKRQRRCLVLLFLSLFLSLPHASESIAITVLLWAFPIHIYSCLSLFSLSWLIYSFFGVLSERFEIHTAQPFAAKNRTPVPSVFSYLFLAKKHSNFSRKTHSEEIHSFWQSKENQESGLIFSKIHKFLHRNQKQLKNSLKTTKNSLKTTWNNLNNLEKCQKPP